MIRNKKLKLVMLAATLFLSLHATAHTVNYTLENAPVQNVVWYYLQLGFTHILPEGLDHILFVTGLCLINTRLKSILWQATVFTVAHSITLALSMKNIIMAPSAIIEPLISLSILFIAIENMLLTGMKPWRLLIVFLFGLIHGMGFASSLNEIGLAPRQFVTSIVSFNIGVELGQIAIITAVFVSLIFTFGNKSGYRKSVVFPISAIIALIAAYWTIQRLFF